MKSRPLIVTVRWLLRLFLLLLGVGVAMNGWGLCLDPESAEVGLLLIVAGLLLPGAEGLFLLLKLAEKKTL